ncbi:hypothetical protein O4H49_20010 [Kiloniella laminariae]|uniref:Uncharacterized protein n=1 Tax=Kiloniella laminariae TaxID=454162 RepID=A0ABT4LQB0_9PROT|nr:hypothetical protein [Kiloniella laminariae]MCZ4283080.1 hypothetical protein [Kiloniella laminariae]
MNKVLSSTIVFAALYVTLVAPVIILPYLGSKSAVPGEAGFPFGFAINPAFWLHLLTYFGLFILTWLRADYIGRFWITALPVCALAFDFVPGLSSVPIISVTFLMVALIVGMISSK